VNLQQPFIELANRKVRVLEENVKLDIKYVIFPIIPTIS